VTHRKTEKEREQADGRGRKGSGEEPNNTIGERVWSSINHAILSAPYVSAVCEPTQISPDLFCLDPRISSLKSMATTDSQ
jgi:hypothetical protein